jgi:predicted nucleic acid-binding protein
MRLFLDASVLLAACGSAQGASREVFRLAGPNRWTLVATPYVVEEVVRNLPTLPALATSEWVRLRSELLILDAVVTIERPSIFASAKDRPILFSALAWADVLLTLDRRDFGDLLDAAFYGLRVLTPGAYLATERADGRVHGLSSTDT